MSFRAPNPFLAPFSFYPTYANQSQSNKPRYKKITRRWSKKEPPSLKKLIDELSTEDLNFEENIIGTESSSVPATENDINSVNFLNLYNQLINAEIAIKKLFTLSLKPIIILD